MGLDAEAKKVLGSYDSVKYVEAPAENVPTEDGTYDAITCVYLFHELPGEVRKAVLKEWMRVLKPGGKVFFVDSAQEGEVPYDRLLCGSPFGDCSPKGLTSSIAFWWSSSAMDGCPRPPLSAWSLPLSLCASPS